MSVPILSMVFMALAALFCFAMPILLLIYYRKKGADILPFFIGCAVFVIFALILESLMHQLVLKVLPVGKTILGNTLLYALYGGLAAGIFEETGRFLAFKTVLKKKLGNDRNALMYGAGHGGIEAILIVGLTYIGNIVISMLINAGQTDVLMATATGEAAEQLKAVFDSLIATAPWTYLLAIVERAVAITTHVCLSVLVWFAVKNPPARGPGRSHSDPGGPLARGGGGGVPGGHDPGAGVPDPRPVEEERGDLTGQQKMR